jgi:signal transduction histidine kinase
MKFKHYPLLVIICLFLLLLLTLPTHITYGEFASSDMHKVIRVAGDNNFPPFEFEKNGTYQGFNVDILNAVSIETGISFEFHPMPWNEALKALENGEVDAIQGMKYSEDRAQIYAFSESYLTSSQGIFVLKNNYSIFSLNDLENHTVSVQKGDIGAEILQRLKNARVISVTNQEEAIQLLLDGKVDAFVGNQITGQYFLQKNGNQDKVKIVGEPISPTNYGMVVLKKNQELLEPVDRGLRQLKKNGTYQKIERKWFGEYIYPPDSRLKDLLTYVITGLVIISVILLVILWWNFTLKKELKKRIDDYKKSMDELARKDRLQSLGQLVAGIAHEIRNPITSILSYSQLLPIKYESKEYREFFSKHVTEEVGRLNRIVNELLDFARQKPPTKTFFQLHDLVNAVILLFHKSLRERKISVRMDVPESLSAWADPQQIKQVLINLIKNSIDAMAFGGLLEVTAEQQQTFVWIRIQDTGEGIEADDLKKIFEPFFTTKANGVGLGLSICYQLITENNGEIEVHSEKGNGTLVIIKLPTQGEE